MAGNLERQNLPSYDYVAGSISRTLVAVKGSSLSSILNFKLVLHLIWILAGIIPQSLAPLSMTQTFAAGNP